MTREYYCHRCGWEWEENGDDDLAEDCPDCGSDRIEVVG
jgi:DNA-directed RNA polymerase subunit RPC12/RpoP